MNKKTTKTNHETIIFLLSFALNYFLCFLLGDLSRSFSPAGTGTNACYMEEMKNVKRIEGEDGRMCINTEWGGFGDDGSLKDFLTEFDEIVDKTSINPGVHTYVTRVQLKRLGEGCD